MGKDAFLQERSGPVYASAGRERAADKATREARGRRATSGRGRACSPERTCGQRGAPTDELASRVRSRAFVSPGGA